MITLNKEFDVTRLLQDYCEGNNDSVNALLPVIYQQLRLIAHRQLRKAWDMDTLCTSALVSEAYIKLFGRDNQHIENRVHFFALAATAMRQIIINYAEQKNAGKRGGDWQRVTLEDEIEQEDPNIKTLLAVDNALEELGKIDSKLARLVELRFFSGMTESEIAELFSVSDRTVRRNWQKARLLLAQALQ